MHWGRLRFIALVLLLGVPLVVNYLLTTSPGMFSDIGLPADRAAGILQVERLDIDGDGRNEIVRLLTEPGEPLFLRNLRLEVLDPGGNITIPITGTDYSTASLNIIQMNGEPEKEIFVTLIKGSGVQDLYGFRVKDGQEQTFFSPRRYLRSEAFDLRYLGGKQVRFTDLTTGLTTTIDLSATNPNYADFTEAELERLYNIQKAWVVGPYSGFSWADLTGDGVKEIIGSRRVSGITPGDIIGTLQEYYRQEAETYKPYAQAFFTLGGQEIAGRTLVQSQLEEAGEKP